jgi:hypothetical protein
LLDAIVAPRVLQAMRAAAAEYERQGVRYALVGGLAVGAQGWPRATQDVDFLVDESAFEHRPGGLVLLKVPFQANGVPIDSLAPAQDEPFLAEERDRAPITAGIPVIGVEALVYMKLKASRMRDRVDVVELLKSGVDPEPCRRWLAVHAPAMGPGFEQLVEQALRESVQ